MWDIEQRQTTIDPSSLAQWLYHAIREPGVRLRIRLRGNNLHILCEGSQVPEVQTILPRLVEALRSQQKGFRQFFRNAEDPIYKIILYGRRIGNQRPNWIESLVLEQILSQQPTSPESLPSEVQPPETDPQKGQQDSTVGGSEKDPSKNGQPSNSHSADNQRVAPHPTLLISNEQLARTGSPEAIARYLSESLSHLGVSVKVLIQKLPDANPTDNKRLWAICTCHYSPDASLIAEPIAQQLRDLELEGFKEAIIRAQVSGEIAPDWVLQIDLTHTEEMLRDWARWGDIQSIDRLLNECLASQGLQVGTVLKETTLHIFCAWDFETVPDSDVPAKENTVAIIEDILENLAPQGLTGATIYGVKSPELQGFIPHESPTLALDHLRDAPLWVSWLELPAATDAYLAPSTSALASQKNPAALTFLIQRLLNPDIDSRLATGGIRVKLCFKGQLLHIMTEAVVCPRQTQVAAAIEGLLNSLGIVGVTGARIYGRRAGQNSPLWSYGIDFESSQPSLESATSLLTPVPEFQEVEAKLSSEEMEVRPPTPLSGWERWRQVIQRGLCATQLFKVRPTEENSPSLGAEMGLSEQDDHTLPVALIWGLLGCLLTIQVDWMGRQYLPASPPTQEVAQMETGNTEAEKKMTQAALLAAARSNNPGFNNPLLEEKLALYQARVKQSGPPDILIVGSSRALRGIDPTVLKQEIVERRRAETPADESVSETVAELEVFNFGINGATAQVVDFVVRQLLTTDQLPQLVIWADGARAFNSGRPDLTFEAITSSRGYRQVEKGRFPRQKNPLYPEGDQVDLSLGALSETLSEGYQEANGWFSEALGEFSALYQRRDRAKTWLTTQLSSPLPTPAEINLEDLDTEITATEDIDHDGFLALDLRFDPDTYYRSHPKVTGAYDQDYDSFALAGQQYEAFQNLMGYLNRHEVEVLFVNLPLTNEYLDPVRSKYEQEFQEHMRAAEDRYGLKFRNLAQRWQNRHYYFSDPSHLNQYGARRVSSHLAEDPIIQKDLGNW
ncbi:D-alanyl-lipoteichoic acid biosynthesis protein DltD [Spirulina sp. CS-785/01]|uniref:D-alanyl-lipoteichoic acid biosynthesis protein DltD n=1 Tax=Spirulina sp. CS-785/01 TaxID=3021716 RepID=UPI00232C8BB9|nr:D-alanyl-lipoteichoic acid biosynthesis protein DltD [Spirulina sp. CS-785/01]MDB9314584.1 D-alanyl-lipoteichoic acid biosynthesis protein DltD [Spirulina sp. CS-785/01]